MKPKNLFIVAKKFGKLKEYDNENIFEYEKILHGSVKEQIAVAIIL